ncbi:uncharacterized membrane protein YjjB (DUF3815 family) [Clostridium punense]|uniref:Uncharacterized membrane protein YjjB (DUF3815 family) n=1 Tax=Clostridium punense TaxID=1054297 RepID=A0ABS4K3S4_9CLOT|nr:MULTISPECIES: threonine/serine exporter family protein [Clostridium]EQB89575.1 hypothetical protein M918_19950 [Clostridium sp. BL8]MBP2022433.1 uncharacterized membrane protein YjjB (DUF3815 family) [Clostridium punense]
MVKQIILAFFGSIFPVILFNIDRRKIIWTGFSGAFGWAVYLLVYNYNGSPVMASFCGAFTVGMYSEILARKLKTPTMQFSVPGIFPLVPGLTAYSTVNYIVEQKYNEAFSKGMQVLGVAGAIAFGIMLATTTFNLIMKVTKVKPKQKNF